MTGAALTEAIWRRCYDRGKKLSTIHQEIEKALASTGADPIQRLERQIASAKHKGDPTEVMEALEAIPRIAPTEMSQASGWGNKTVK